MQPPNPRNPVPATPPADRTKDFFAKAPSVSLPKGGGALSSIGESFSANPVTGTAAFSIPVALSPGRGGFGPAMQLAYDSGAGNSPFGIGWRSDVPSISRKTDKGLPRYHDVTDVDTFTLSGAEDLVPVGAMVEGAWVDEEVVTQDWRIRRYRPRVEGDFSRIERWTSRADHTDVHWRVRGRDNSLRLFGLTAGARVVDPADPKRTFEWLLEEVHDERGHRALYTYKPEDEASFGARHWQEKQHTSAWKYLKRIQWGNATPFQNGGWLFQAVLDYGEHDLAAPTPAEDTPWPMRADPFSWNRAGFEQRCRRLCRRVLMFHHFPELGEDPVLVRSTELTHQAAGDASRLVSARHRGWTKTAQGYDTLPTPAVSFTYTEASTDPTVRFVSGLEDIPGAFQQAGWQWVDLDGEGAAGLLAEQAGAWYYKRNLGDGKLAPARPLASRPSFDLRSPHHRLMDVDGDGQIELVRTGPPPTAGFWKREERDGELGWAPFKAFRDMPSLLNWTDGSVRLLDLTGDGRPDALINVLQGSLWFPSTGADGYGVPSSVPLNGEKEGPLLLHKSQREAVFLADMTGDGLPDIVWVVANSVSYWPNLGYGRFGKKVAMASPPGFGPEDRFDPSRVRLADVDGTGPADLVYLGERAVRIWRNASGNAYLPEERVEALPPMSSVDGVDITDLEGTGTACLVWSSALLSNASRPLRYVRLMAEGKPHLLKSIDNGLGRVTTLTYTPSTHFQAADARAGRPWATRLPFPVHCLSKVEVVDAFSGLRHTQTFAYHHGCYDGHEREFRGFGCVETWDAERLSDISGAPDLLVQPPPVRTVRWYHTGVWEHERKLLDAYATEWWSGDSAVSPLGRPVFPTGLGLDTRDAWRALKGQLLREEVYADDGSPAAATPYTVTEARPALRRLQAPRAAVETSSRRRAALPPVFQVIPHESITRHYERDATDPRAAHTLALQVDAYGEVTEEAVLSYPRRSVPQDLPEQGTLTVLVSRRTLLHDTTDPGTRLHLGLPVSATSHALHGGAWTDTAPATHAALTAALGGASTLAYEATPTTGWQLRQLGEERTTYWNDALTAALPLGQVGARALPHQRYQLAITPGLLTDVFSTDATEAMLTTEAGYVDLDDDDRWWVPSGVVTPSAAAFYQPVALTDAWGQSSAVTWDAHALFPVEVEDALGLVTTATHDYARLQPTTVTDPNGTSSEAAYDALGRLVATAVRKGSDGDAAASWSTELTYVDDVLPASVRTRQRTTHGGTVWLEAVAYSDGGGNVIQTKTRVAPGDAPALVAGNVAWSAADPRWVGSGRTVFDRKGQPVKQYEPFFSHDDAFEAEDVLAAWGVSPVLTYDPAGRLVRTDLPDGAHRKVTFDAWKLTAYDECDTEAAGDHEGTPTVSHLDAQGRPVRVHETPDGVEVYETRLLLDVTGNPVAVIDPRGNTVQTQTFDLLGRPLRTVSPEDGTTRVLFDVAGQPVRTWKTGSLHLQATFDAGRRPVSLLADGVRVQHTVYGDMLQSPPANALGRPVEVWDTAGRLAFTYDFKGRPLTETRRVLADITVDADWDTLDAQLLDAEDFTVATTYDALDRPTSQTAPDGAVTTPSYDAGGRLVAVEVDSTPVVTSMTYDARGQRQSIAYGNHTSTAYTYDPERFWLTRLHTTRASTSTHGAATLQDLTYTRDLVGNPTSIADDAQETLYFANAQVSPTRTFQYDALYRLVRAEGREKDGLTQTTHELPTAGAIPDSGNPALRRYTQSYEYDEVGNLLEMKHQLGSGGSVLWKRDYTYASGSNRLLTTSMGQSSLSYDYDARGALSNLPHLQGFTRDFRDQLRKVVLDLAGNEAWYAHDGAGQRVRKLVDKGATTEERIYVGGWEVWRKRVNGTLDEERTTLHVRDGERRVAMVETKTVAGGQAVGSPVARWRFQLDDHLGSAVSECDEEGGVFSYEELHPYGSVAWSAVDSALDVSPRRYRYTGMERDEETGLQAHGVRMYAPWLGRWDRPDPIGLGDGVNRWGYVHGGPTRGKDTRGMEDQDEIAATYARNKAAFDAARSDAVSAGWSSWLDPGAWAESAQTAASGAFSFLTLRQDEQVKVLAGAALNAGSAVLNYEPMTPGKHIGVLVTGTVDEASSAGTAQGERDYAIQSEIAKEVLGSAAGAGVAKAVDRGLDAARGAARADAPPTPARVEVVASQGAARGLSGKGGIFTATENAAGGRVVTSVGEISHSDVATQVNSALYAGGDVRVLSGAHGLPDGTMIPEASFLAEDVKAFGSIPGVTVSDVTTMSASEISGALQGSGTTIGAFCNSGACLEPFK